MSVQDREQIISYLLQSGDNKDRIIEELQKKIAVLEKTLADTKPADAPKE